MAGIVLVHTFINAVEAFMDRFEVDRKNSGIVHSILFNCLCRDAPLTAEGDPEERVAKFFAKIDRDILQLSSKFSYKREDILQVYLKALFDLRQTQNCQRKGVLLSRVDHVRLQYSTVRIAEEIILKSSFIDI